VSTGAISVPGWEVGDGKVYIDQGAERLVSWASQREEALMTLVIPDHGWGLLHGLGGSTVKGLRGPEFRVQAHHGIFVLPIRCVG